MESQEGIHGAIELKWDMLLDFLQVLHPALEWDLGTELNGHRSPTKKEALFVVALMDGSFSKQCVGGYVFDSFSGASGTTTH